jgi:aryl-alcohol dehydrogenase-like predicted oxidoreductase
MRYRLLGNTGLYVSVLGLGTNMFGGEGTTARAYGALGHEEAAAMIGTALDGGLNFIDTADGYGGGESEQLIGRALGDLQVNRSKVVICTKFSNRVGDGPNDMGGTRSRIFDALETSLKRLKTDYIDVYTMHAYDRVTPLEETLRALGDAVTAGKVRYIACSNFTSWQMMKAIGISQRLHYPRFEAMEGLYTLGARDVERDIVPMLLDQQASLLVWGPLASGILTGKYNSDGSGPSGSRLTIDGDKLRGDLVAGDVERAFVAADALKPMAQARGVTMSQLALAWLLHQPAVTTVLFGSRSARQIRENLAAADIDLTTEESAQLNNINALKTEYPAWTQRLFARRRAQGVTQQS